MRINSWMGDDGEVRSGLTVSEVKRLIRKQGGCGCTEHYDRDGSLCESSPITLESNRGTAYEVKYNHHM